MPPGQAGSLSDSSYVDLVAYLLESNGAVPGERTLTAAAGVTIGDAADISEARRAAQAGERLRRRSSRFVNQEVPHELIPVTDAMLADPPPGDWLSWRRTRNSPRLQPARSSDARQRRRSEARMVDLDPAGQPPDDATGA